MRRFDQARAEVIVLLDEGADPDPSRRLLAGRTQAIAALRMERREADLLRCWVERWFTGTLRIGDAVHFAP